MKVYLAILSMILTLTITGQDCSFKSDTLFIHKDNKLIDGEIIETTLKNGSILQLIKGPSNRYFLKLIITENLYFDKIDQLEIISGKKSIYYKDVHQYQYDKHRGFYLIEIFRNYVLTLKENGITSIVFGKTETAFTKTDTNQIKLIADCLYAGIAPKK